MEQPFEVRDLRVKEKFFVDDAYLNGYARLCGVYCTAIYNSLCRHADKGQRAFPSIERMAEQHNISKPTVIKALRTLESWGIIAVHKGKNEDTKRQENNVYILCDKRYWKPKPGKPRLPGAESISRAEPGKSHDESRVNDVYRKDTHLKDTHIRIEKGLENIRDIMQQKGVRLS